MPTLIPQIGCWLESGVSRGSARKPMRASGGRDHVLAKMLVKTGGRRGQILAGKFAGASGGRGQSAPSPPVRRPEEKGRHTNAPVPMLVFPRPSPCIWIGKALQSLIPKQAPGHPKGRLPPLWIWRCVTCVSEDGSP